MLTVKSFAFNPVQENTYVLSDQKDACCIIDPGCYFDEERTIFQEYIEQQGLSPKILLNTHCHFDHVFGNKFVHDTWNLPPHLHEKEEPVLALAAEMAGDWGMPFKNYHGKHHLLVPGDTITIGDDHLTILFLPGHSPGSVGFYSHRQGFLIGGDVLFLESIGRTDLPGGDLPTLIHSIRTQLMTLPDQTIVYPGHGDPTTIGHERTHNPYLR